jgi:UDP-N-acetylglucosamine transferase subunit ALG13
MILVTCGTNEQPFDRLVRAAHTLAGGEALLVQHGSSQVPHGPGEWIDFLPFEELADRMRDARVVVSHAGVGSIMLARRCGKRPVVLPRRVGRGEAVDDHQLPLAHRLHAGGIVTLVEDEGRLANVVRSVDGRAEYMAGTRPPGTLALAQDVRETLERLTGRQSTGTR